MNAPLYLSMMFFCFGIFSMFIAATRVDANETIRFVAIAGVLIVIGGLGMRAALDSKQKKDNIERARIRTTAMANSYIKSIARIDLEHSRIDFTDQAGSKCRVGYLKAENKYYLVQDTVHCTAEVPLSTTKS